MKPNCPGLWEWFDEHGNKRLIEVVDTLPGIHPLSLKVRICGALFNIDNEEDNKPVWPDNWGNLFFSYVGLDL